MYESRLLTLLDQCSGLVHHTMTDLVANNFHNYLGEEKQSDDVSYFILSTEHIVDYTLQSSMDSLTTVRDAVSSYYKSNTHWEAIAFAAHELIVNAIEHRNQLNENKTVQLHLAPGSIVVEDEMDGFHWRDQIESQLSLDIKALDVRVEGGQEIAMVKMLVGDLIYNEEGNPVSVILR